MKMNCDDRLVQTPKFQAALPLLPNFEKPQRKNLKIATFPEKYCGQKLKLSAGGRQASRVVRKNMPRT
jgi:hypothetical protein